MVADGLRAAVGDAAPRAASSSSNRSIRLSSDGRSCRIRNWRGEVPCPGGGPCTGGDPRPQPRPQPLGAAAATTAAACLGCPSRRSPSRRIPTWRAASYARTSSRGSHHKQLVSERSGLAAACAAGAPATADATGAQATAAAAVRLRQDAGFRVTRPLPHRGGLLSRALHGIARSAAFGGMPTAPERELSQAKPARQLVVRVRRAAYARFDCSVCVEHVVISLLPAVTQKNKTAQLLLIFLIPQPLTSSASAGCPHD